LRRRHRMPFGAEVLEIGETRFALWAPAAETVDLVLEDDARPMHREEDGTFALTTEAAPGTRYRYRLDGGEEVPDPGAEETFRKAVLGWENPDDPEHAGWLELYGGLLALRREKILPRLGGIPGGEAAYRLVGERGLSVRWTLGDGSLLALLANLGPEPLGGFERPPGELLYASEGATEDGSELPAWSVAWYMREPG
jgi:1,4-alpha-glucan branching enzyme